MTSLVRALRPYQWVKNLLLFVPLVTSHRLLEMTLVGKTLIALVAFSLCASAIYVANDLLDIDADRQHPRKRLRPFASGDLSIPTGLFLFASLVLVSMFVSLLAVSVEFSLVLCAYIVVSMLYSLVLKRLAIVDVFLLTGLYVVRIFAGGVATGIAISTWLLTFAMFLFLNLAFVKRFTELNVSGKAVGRGYLSDDRQWLQIVGTSAGYMAVLVLALYASEPAVVALYRRPAVLIFLCPLLLYWVTRLWFNAMRNAFEDDPVLEAVKDPVSYVILAISAVILVEAR